jgi:hypothetical protein
MAGYETEEEWLAAGAALAKCESPLPCYPSRPCEACGAPSVFYSNSHGYNREHRFCVKHYGMVQQQREQDLAKELRWLHRVDRVCRQCGATFTPTRSDGAYCSHACRQRAYRWRSRQPALGLGKPT